LDENFTGRVCPSHFIVVIFYIQDTIDLGRIERIINFQ